jgi:Fe2+ transport system protein FeoA
MTLAKASMKTPCRVRGFRDLTDAERTRLSSLGLRAGSVITKVLKTPLRDPVECLVGPQLLAVDSWLLERILIEPSAA